MRVGGAVEWLLEPSTPEEFRRAVGAAREEGFALHVDGESKEEIARSRAPSSSGRDGARGAAPSSPRGPIRILGGGANLIVDDGVLPGVVIATDRMRRLFRPEPAPIAHALDAEEMSPRTAPAPREEGLRFVAWCGVSMPKIVNAAAELGWSGVEGLAGVPGNVGGGIAMNAGGKWGEMWDVVERVLVIDERGEMRELAREECAPRYRNGGLATSIVAAAVLSFRLDEVAGVKERGRTFLLEKNRVQPVTAASAGCVFKNPDREKSGGRSAGQLVEHCSLKGRAIGDALVSPLHGNFIVNRGRARASDVLALIAEVRAVVADKTGIELELEAKIWRAKDTNARVPG
jgi:UDP-N-acetylmuramate dehydrogenase